MKKFLLAVLFSVFSNICVEASQEEAIIQDSNRVISTEDVIKAEEGLNERFVTSLYSKVMTIFKYLKHNDWTIDEIAEKYNVEAKSVEKVLNESTFYGTIFDHVCDYYVQGGESVIGVLPPHKQQTNWVDSMMSWFCGHHDPQEHHQQKIIKTQ